MTLELSYQNVAILLAFTVGFTWFFSKCDTQYMIKKSFRHSGYKAERWFIHRIRDCERFNASMTLTRWYVFGITCISGIFLPVFVMNFSLDPLQNHSLSWFMHPVIVAEYFFIIGLVTYVYLKGRRKGFVFTNPPHSKGERCESNE